MSILGSDSPDDPEEKIERDEQKVVKHLENIDRRLNQILQDEKDLMKQLEEGGNERRLKTQLSNIEIALQEDIQEGESSIADEVQALREEEEKFAKQGRISEDHQQMLELLGEIVPELHDEEQRIQELVQTGNKFIRSQELDHQKAAKAMEEHVKKDQEEALDLKNKIEKAEELEKNIVEHNS
jgi:hypothetical protein